MKESCQSFGKLWEEHVTLDIKAFNRWVSHWIGVAESKKLPVIFVRFEDLLNDLENQLQMIFKFLLGMDSVEGTVIEQRIKHALVANSKVGYKPRSGGINSNV